MPTKTLMTAAEFFQTGPETDGHELVRGELVAMPPAGTRHGHVCLNTGYLLKTYTKTLGRGTVTVNDAGMITEQDPDTVRGADVALYLNPSWQGQAVPLGYVTEPPDVAVEVRSPSQTWAQVVAKVGEYLAMGVKMVWVLDPQRERLTVFRPDQEPVVYAPENELDGGDVLPGFHCRVAEFFE